MASLTFAMPLRTPLRRNVRGTHSTNFRINFRSRTVAYHYLVEAMLKCGMREEALDLMRRYWGGMVRAGASTFWEVYDPADPLLSPYSDHHLNSYRHAWSCTPSYFIRKYFSSSTVNG
jgi:hypothetical protein